MSDTTGESAKKKVESKPIGDRADKRALSQDAAVESETGNKKNADSPNPIANRNFEEMAAAENVGIVREFIDFLKNNKKWWLTPIILVLLLVGVMIALTTSGAAPFLYTFW